MIMREGGKMREEKRKKKILKKIRGEFYKEGERVSIPRKRGPHTNGVKPPFIMARRSCYAIAQYVAL